MKRIIVTIAATVLSQAVFASELYCGANIEQNLGSQVYNKLVFWEKADSTKPALRFLLTDGTLIKADNTLTPDQLNTISDGSLAINISFIANRTQLFLGKVKRNEKNEINFVDMASTGSINGNSLILVANGAVLECLEM